jgi:nicotinamide mononucleotide adenylyltransferase
MNTKNPTAMFVGRYQPFHDGHKALIVEGIKRVGQVCIAVRDTQGTSEKDPFDFETVKKYIEEGLAEYEGKFTIIQIPNITDIFYGRDVGYNIERIHLGEDLESISATDIRKKMDI